MGCASSTASPPPSSGRKRSGVGDSVVKVAPRSAAAGDTSGAGDIERKESGSDMSLKEAILNVYQTHLVNKYGDMKKKKKNVMLEQVDSYLVIAGELNGVKADDLPHDNSDEFREQCRLVFADIDKNHDSRVSFEEFKEWYLTAGAIHGRRATLGELNESFQGPKKAVARAFFGVMDRHVRTAEIQIAELWLDKRGGFTEEEALQALKGLFKVYDANGDGVLDPKEFGNLMLEIQDARLEAEGRTAKGIKYNRLSQRAAKAVIDMMDEDGSGTLDMDEFIHTLKESLSWNDERCRAAADRLAEGNEDLSDHLVEFFEAMVWCIGKYIRKGGVKRRINLERFFESDRQAALWNQE